MIARGGRLLIALALGVVLLLVASLGLVRGPGRADPAAPAGRADAPAADAILRPSASDGLDGLIASLQDRLRSVPADWRASASLGLAYVQQARITGDPSYYPKAQGVLERSLEQNRADNADAMVGMAALSAARHEFSDALRWGRRALRISPADANVYGAIGDAQVELGRYGAAFDTFQTMVDTRPDLASYARVAYARELQGDVAGATDAMRGAATFAGTPADAAWASYQLGELAWNSGDLDRAASAYRRAATADPTFVPPEAGLAKVAWARGDLDRAISGYEDVVARYPLPEHVIALGDLYALVGDRANARAQYDLVRAEQQLFAANGVNVDLELAVFDAEHGDPARALAAARDEWSRRHSVHVADALAWALHANGRDLEAATYSRRALALGYWNANFLYHAGEIQLALGHRDAAASLLRDAIELNPNFSFLHAAEARDTLQRLEGRA